MALPKRMYPVRATPVRLRAATICTLSPPLPPICESCSQSADEVASHGSSTGMAMVCCAPTAASSTASSTGGTGSGPGTASPSSAHEANIMTANAPTAVMGNNDLNFFIAFMFFVLLVDAISADAKRTCRKLRHAALRPAYLVGNKENIFTHTAHNCFP